MSKLSVIIPVYNVEDYLRQCLDSIINQSLEDIQIICVNDGSKDNSLNILNEYAQKDNRIVVISQENQGQGIARNKGLEIANGEIIVFLDPDDWFELNSFEILYNKYKSTNADVIQFNYQKYIETNNKYKQINTIKKELHLSNIGQDKNIAFNKFFVSRLMVWDKCYKTEFVKNLGLRFSPNKIMEDHIFAIGSMLMGNDICCIPNVLYNYRCRIGSSTNKTNNDAFCIFDNLLSIKDFLEKQGLYDNLKDKFQNYAKTVLNWHYVLISQDRLPEYEEKCIELIKPKNKNKFLRFVRNEKFIESIFSIKNVRHNEQKSKVITILGISIKLGKEVGE